MHAKNDNHLDGLVQERRNSTVNALDLHLSCTNPSIYALNSVIANEISFDAAK